MKLINRTGNPEIATVFIADSGNGKLIEFVESVQPPVPRHKKWVIIISTLFGCPVKCLMCDAGDSYRGKLTAREMLWQVCTAIESRFPECFETTITEYLQNPVPFLLPVEKFKIQLARMGDPAFNPEVLQFLRKLPDFITNPGLVPSVSTIAPAGCDRFLNELKEIRFELYRQQFQMQFSIHSTDEEKRDRLIPVKKWSFAQIARYGENFFCAPDRKITLNFAADSESDIDAEVLLRWFDPQKFMLKLTPVNPTVKARQNKLHSFIHSDSKIPAALQEAGYDVIISIGELEENKIGSNCGQHIMNFLNSEMEFDDSYQNIKFNIPEKCA